MDRHQRLILSIFAAALILIGVIAVAVVVSLQPQKQLASSQASSQQPLVGQTQPIPGAQPAPQAQPSGQVPSAQPTPKAQPSPAPVQPKGGPAGETGAGPTQSQLPPPNEAVPAGQGSGASQSTQLVAVNKLPTIYEFYADWCPACKQMVPIIDQLEKQYTNKAEFVRLNVDKRADMVKAHDITVIPVQIIVDKNGKQVFRHEGFMSKQELVAQLKKLGVK